MHAIASYGRYCSGSLKVEGVSSKHTWDEESIATYEQAVQEVRLWSRAEWKEESGNASRAIKLESKGIGHPVPLQRALVLPTMATNLKAFIDERSQADAILMRAGPSLGQSHIADYPDGHQRGDAVLQGLVLGAKDE